METYATELNALQRELNDYLELRKKGEKEIGEAERQEKDTEDIKGEVSELQSKEAVLADAVTQAKKKVEETHSATIRSHSEQTQDQLFVRDAEQKAETAKQKLADLERKKEEIVSQKSAHENEAEKASKEMAEIEQLIQEKKSKVKELRSVQ